MKPPYLKIRFLSLALLALLILAAGFGALDHLVRSVEQRRSALERVEARYNELTLASLQAHPDVAALQHKNQEIIEELAALSVKRGRGVDRLWVVLQDRAARWEKVLAGLAQPGSSSRSFRQIEKVHSESDEALFAILAQDLDRSMRTYRALLGLFVLVLIGILAAFARYSRKLRSEVVGRHIALADLDESQERFRALIGSVNDYVIVLGHDLRIYTAFGNWFEIYGPRPEELWGRPFTDFIGSESAADFRFAAQKAWGGAPSSFEYLHQEFQRHLFVEVLPLSTGEGPVEGLMVVSRDITDLVLARERYRAISETTSDFAYSFRLDPQGQLHLEWISEAFERMTGVDPKTIPSLSEFGRLVHPDDIPAVVERMTRGGVVERGSQEYRYLLAGGRIMWVLDQYRVEDLGGGMKRILGSAQDITRRKTAELTLVRSESRYRSLVESFNDLVFELDTELRLVAVHGKWLQRYGLTGREFLGQRVDAIEQGGKGQTALQAAAECLKGRPVTYDTYFEKRRRWMLVNLNPLFGEGGAVKGVMGIIYDITDVKNLEETQRQFAELTADYFYKVMVTPDGGYEWEWVGPDFERVLGVKPDLFREPGDWHKIIHPEDLPGFQEGLRELSEGRNVDREFRVHKGRELVWIKLIKKPLMREGKLVGFWAAGKDITKEKKLQQILAARDRQYRHAVEHSSDILINVDAKGEIEFVSPAVTRVLGYRPEELTGRHFDLLIHPEDLPWVMKVFQELVTNPGVVRSVRTRVRAADGRDLTVEATGWCQANEKGELQVHSSVRDITPLLEAERRSKVLEQAAQAVEEGILILRWEQGLVTPFYANEGFFRVTGYTGVVEQFDLAFFRGPGISFQKWGDLMGQMEKFRPWNGELKLLRDDGTRWQCLLEVQPFEVGEGSGRYLVVNLRDITETVKAQEVLLKYERLVTVGEISAGVAHEIKNPLAVIRLNAQNMQQEPGAAASEELETILAQCDRVNRILQETLDLQGKMAVRRELVNLGEVVHRALEQAKAQFGSSSATFRIEVGEMEGLPPLYAQSERLERMFSNLILNAFQAMAPGGRLGLYAKADPRAIKITVRDSGHGVPEKDVDRIFEPFFTTKRHGSGMGLAVCQRIVEEHGGWISIEKHPVGTAFEVWLPIGQKPEKGSDNESFDFG